MVKPPQNRKCICAVATLTCRRQVLARAQVTPQTARDRTASLRLRLISRSQIATTRFRADAAACWYYYTILGGCLSAFAWLASIFMYQTLRAAERIAGARMRLLPAHSSFFLVCVCVFVKCENDVKFTAYACTRDCGVPCMHCMDSSANELCMMMHTLKFGERPAPHIEGKWKCI